MTWGGVTLYRLKNSTWTNLASWPGGLATDTWYSFRVVMDGPDFTVWERERDGSEPSVKRLKTMSADVPVSNYIQLDAQAGGVRAYAGCGQGRSGFRVGGSPWNMLKRTGGNPCRDYPRVRLNMAHAGL
jgi:hypothetical protein